MTPSDKRETFLALLEKGWVSVCLDARRDGVQLPERFRTQARLVLQYGLDMPVPILDLDATPEGIRATLSFDRMPQSTFIPWSAVYMLAREDGQGVLYEEDVPPEVGVRHAPADAEAAHPEGKTDEDGVKARVGKPHSGKTGGAKSDKSPAPRPALSMVPASDGDAPTPPRPGKRPTLRLVK